MYWPRFGPRSEVASQEFIEEMVKSSLEGTSRTATVTGIQVSGRRGASQDSLAHDRRAGPDGMLGQEKEDLVVLSGQFRLTSLRW